ncbi:sigma-70 family RNA polymerase sigma factor [Gemella morbillorum]
MKKELCFYVLLLKRDKMICDNMRLVPFVYNKYFRHNSNPDLIEDLIQTGYCGLITAVDEFDESRNFKFSSFAAEVIKQRMIQEVKKLSYALGTRNKRNGEAGEANALPFSHFDTQNKAGETVNIIETNYYKDEDINLGDMAIKTYIKYKKSLSEFDLAVLERIEKGMRQVDIAKELHTSQKKVSRYKRKMQNELKAMLL